MHNQTTLTSTERPLRESSPPLPPGTYPPVENSGMSRNVASFGSDLVQLMDLQAALFKADAREAAKKTVPPTALFTLGLMILLGLFPILMAGLASLLAENGWAWSSALLTVAGGSFVLVALLGVAGWLLLRSGRGAFTRSLYEWDRNKKWVKESLKQRF